jgi:hypothetical protein
LNDFDDATLGFALTQLTRGQNRLVSALQQARRLARSEEQLARAAA